MKTALIGLGRIGWGFHRVQILEHSRLMRSLDLYASTSALKCKSERI